MGIFIDFSKAFDTINHEILLKKLLALNFSNSAVQLIKHYLTDRSQCVAINQRTSSFLKIKCGIPQGSILGPTLFLLYINDLVFHSKLFQTILFADDTNLFFQSKNLNNDVDKINEGLDILKDWCNANKLTLNTDKTNYIVLKNPQNHFRLSREIRINNSKIKSTESLKFLGVTIDNKLNWSIHIEFLRKQLRQSLGLIYQASLFLPNSSLIMLYNSLINSKIVYCLEAWGNAPETHLNKILVIQKRTLRVIFHKPPTYHSATLFKKANVLPIHQLYTHRLCTLAHTVHSTQSHDFAYSTRSSALSIKRPNFLSACGQRHVAYQMSVLWNSLPVKLREISGLSRFKATLKQHLLDSLT